MKTPNLMASRSTAKIMYTDFFNMFIYYTDWRPTCLMKGLRQ